MGPSSVCEHCSKKFKVFAKRRKCTHCHSLLCRSCIDPHVRERHPNVATASSHESSSYASEDDDVHFQSPQSASRSNSASSFGSTSASARPKPKTSTTTTTTESAVDLLDDLDGVDVVEVDENENEDDDDDDGNDEDLLLGGFSRRASMEEEENQFREFTQLQHAVTQWAKAELEIKRQQRLAKQSSRVYATKPVRDFGSTRANQQRELFAVSYAVFVTLTVWAMFALVMAIFMRVLHRTLALAS